MKIISGENVTKMQKTIAISGGKVSADKNAVDKVHAIAEAHGMSHGSHRQHSSS